jgi:hypothetical protein
MRAQVKLIRDIMNKVLRYPWHGEATWFTVNYEVFYVIDCILKNKNIDSRQTKHMVDEQISALYSAGITQEDVAEVQHINGRNINLMQNTMVHLMTVAPISVQTAQYEIIRVLLHYPQSYNGTYKFDLKNSNITDVEMNYVFAPYRMEAVRGMILFSHVTAKEAFDKLSQSSEQQIKGLWWEAEETRIIVVSIAAEMVRKNISLNAYAEDVMKFMTDGTTTLLNEAQQAILKTRNILFVRHLFNEQFNSSVQEKIKKDEIQGLLVLWERNFSRLILQSNVSTEALEAHQQFVDCYTKNNCFKLFSQPNIAALLRTRTFNHSAPANDAIEAIIPEFLNHHPEFITQQIMARNNIKPTMLLFALSFIADNPVIFEVGVLSLLMLVLFRNHAGKLNPFKACNSPVIEEIKDEEKQSLITAKSMI